MGNVERLWSLVSEQTRLYYKEYTGNVERLWSLVSEQTRLYYKENTDKAPVIDVMKAGYMKVTGKGQLPEQPLIVKARYFTKEAETKIKDAGGVCVLCG